jgi:hypothetical protein
MLSPVSESDGPPLPSAQAFLLAMYKEQCDQARQHESLRQQSTTLILAMCSAAMALSGVLIATTIKTPDSEALIDPGLLLSGYALIGVFIALLSILGRRLSLVHYERNRQHTAQARSYRELLERSFPDLMISSDRRSARQAKASAGGGSSDGNRSKFFRHWADIYWFVTALGALLTVTPLAMAVAANAAVRCPAPPI